MEGITIKGRGYHDPRLTVSTDENGVTIHADDARYEEIWTEVRISAQALAELLARYLTQSNGGNNALFVNLEEFAATCEK